MDAASIRRFVKEEIAHLRNDEVSASEITDDEVLSSDPDTPETHSLELDSLDKVELALAIETEFNVGTPEDLDFTTLHTVNDIVEFVIALLEQKPVK